MLAASNRLDMLSSGAVLLSTDIKAMNCTLLFSQAWDLLVQADADMRSAAELSKSGGYRDVNDAVAINEAVLQRLDQAADLLAQAQEAFAEVDFTAINTYLTLKKESAALAISSDQALLAADLDSVYAQNAAFVQKDVEVVAAAAKIPAAPFTLISLAYEAATSAEKQRFDSARANVTDADAHIREYLGVETQTKVQ